MVQVNTVASEQSSNFFECSFFAIDMVVRGIVLVGSPGNIEFAVWDDFVVISFLTRMGGGGAEDREQQNRTV